jgi:glycosyltransferase involved in cell wall biosynthesis
VTAIRRRRARVLFAVPSLVQAGAERYLYEFARALDKDRFEVQVLTPRSVTADEFYCVKLRELGIPVHREVPDGREHLIDLIPKKRRLRPLREALERLDAQVASLEARKLRAFLSGFDVVSLIQIEMYYRLARALSERSRAVIHLMSHRFQYDRDPYAKLRPGARYRLCLFDEAQSHEIAGTPAEGADMTLIPLALDLSGREARYDPPARAPKTIAIVSRIDPSRRFEQLLYSFQALCRRLDVRLHVYGRGDPETLRHLLDPLRIRDKVEFKGHAENLEATLCCDQPDLVWMISIDTIIGYGGIETGSFGFPIAFYNHGAAPDAEVLEGTGGAIASASTIPEFVALSQALLEDPEARRSLGARLRAHVLRENDIRPNVRRLEAFYERVIGDAP